LSPKAERKGEAKRGGETAAAPRRARSPLTVPALFVGVAGVGCTGFLLASGASVTASTLLLVGASASLGLTLHLAWRSGRALVGEEDGEELRVATGRRRKELEREKQSLVKALKELEFDHEMRKISDGDYREIAATYRARALRVMRQLDEGGVDYRKLIEYDLQAHRAAAAAPAPPQRQTQTQTQTQTGTGTGTGAIGRLLCANCQTDNETDATFCKKCGKPIGGAP
jgi:hypothetical protein